MTKKAVKKLTLQDFLMPTLSDEPTKLMLIKDGKETDQYLEVISAAHKKLKRAKMKYGMANNKLLEQAREIESVLEQNVFYTEEKLNIDTDYALELVTGWSLGEFDMQLLESLLRDNDVLVSAIIARAHDTEAYTVKK